MIRADDREWGEEDILLTSQQIADRMHMSIRTLWRMVKAGKMPQPIRFNRKLVRWKREDIDGWLAGQRTS